MSDFFRIHAQPHHHGMTIRQLAEAVHKAEGTEDDVSLAAAGDIFSNIERLCLPRATLAAFTEVAAKMKEGHQTKEEESE